MNLRKIILSLFFLLSFLSCNKDKANLVIDDFSVPKKIELTPYKWKPYALINIRVKGYANDTIKIKQTPPFYDIDLAYKIDTIIQVEYYGGGGVKSFLFDPYKANKGNLTLNIQL